MLRGAQHNTAREAEKAGLVARAGLFNAPRQIDPERLRLSLRCRTIWAVRCSTGKVLHRTARPFQQ